MFRQHSNHTHARRGGLPAGMGLEPPFSSSEGCDPFGSAIHLTSIPGFGVQPVVGWSSQCGGGS